VVGGAHAEPIDSVRLLAVGDVLPHFNVVRAARENGTAENFYFGALLSDAVRERVQGADVAFANLETPIAAKEYNARKPFVFNAPYELAPALGWMGFDILSVANNHSYDQSRKGVSDTLQAIARAGLESVGSAPSRKEALEGKVIEIRGLRVGFLAFADMFNGEPKRDRPAKTWVARLKDRKLALQAVRAMRERVDVVVVSVHWGQEYETVVNARQKQWARAFSDAGADLILGHHPHVLQPIEWLTSKKRGRKTLVAYSLGNFISNQQAGYRLGQKPLSDGDTRDGLLLEVELTREGVKGFEAVPTWTHQARRKKLTITVRDLRHEIAQLEAKRRKPSSTRAELKHLRERLTRIESILAPPQVLPPKTR
jgi:poly-gamma-glutamate synthesis protein (capsule biosynthesis protein)